MRKADDSPLNVSGGAMSRLSAWRTTGTVVPMACTTGTDLTHRVWLRVVGTGAWSTLLHGFPTSSFDMADIADRMAGSRRVLCVDMVGFGESDRPAEHVYSISEQADAVVTVWDRLGVAETDLFAHDLGASVAQELLWRAQNHRLHTTIRSVVFANGGIYPELHRPLPFQTALADPQQGAAVSAAITEETMGATLRLTFGPDHLPDAEGMTALWSTVSRNDGHHNLHLLIRYMEERRVREADWVGAMESAPMPVGFAWGMLDPISGAHIAARVRERFPGVPARFLADVGHWPPLEAPDACVAVLAEVDALASAR